MVRKCLLSKITLNNFVNTAVLATAMYLGIVCGFEVKSEYDLVVSENTTIKHERKSDQEMISDLQKQVDVLNSRLAKQEDNHRWTVSYIENRYKDRILVLQEKNKNMWNMFVGGEVPTQPKDVTKLEIMDMNVSAYTASVRECGKKNGKTSTGERVKPRKTCAVSRDLKKRLTNKKLWIENFGVVRVNDLMADKYRGKKIRNSLDVAMLTQSEAYEFGRKQLKVVVLN